MEQLTFDKMATPPLPDVTIQAGKADAAPESARMVKYTAPEGDVGINPGGHGDFRVIDGQIEVPEDLPQSAVASLLAHGYTRS